MVSAELPAPVTPQRMRATYDVSPTAMRVTYRPRSWGTACFLGLWLTGWTVGCVFLAHQAINDPKPFNILFGIPFWVSWLFVAAVLSAMLFRRQELAVDGEGLRYADWIIIRVKHRWIPRSELRGFNFEMRQSHSSDSDSTPQPGLVIRTLGKPLWLFPGLPEMELRWLAHQLSHLVDVLPGESQASDRTDPDEASPPADRAWFPQPLALAHQPVEPPSDCSWQLLPAFDAVEFVQHGRLSWAMVLVLLFINAFWNGIVSVFVIGLIGAKNFAGANWWGQFFFLIPFEVIGLVMVVGLVFALLEPLRRRTWRFDAYEIESRWQYLGVGPRWIYAVESLGRIDLVRESRGRNKRLSTADTGGWQDGGTHFGLWLVRPDNSQLCEISSLTEGEARWMADTILRERPEWFR